MIGADPWRYELVVYNAGPVLFTQAREDWAGGTTDSDHNEAWGQDDKIRVLSLVRVSVAELSGPEGGILLR